MPDDSAIRKALREKTGWSAQSLSNRVSALIGKRLMSRIHALYVLAHLEGVKLENFGVDDETLIKVGELALASDSAAAHASPAQSGSTKTSLLTEGAKRTPASTFSERGFHERVVAGKPEGIHERTSSGSCS